VPELRLLFVLVRVAALQLGVCSVHAGVYYLRIENAEGYVLIAVYLFIYLYACYSHNSKSIQPNHMKFGGMIGYYPGTI